MSRRKPRRQKRPRAASLGEATAKVTNITLAEGEHKGMFFTLYGLSDQDVAEARRACAAGQPNDTAFLVVIGLFQALGLDYAAYEWSMDEVLDLFAMVGLPVSGWGVDMDAELRELLNGAIS
ncbi:hypothetical protein HEP87_26850 [Streptomyces sp. S1D4-11]|nr:hypothetical protein [Streptomyces sp. S1D4-11]QIY96959.1 hypothetical protein HEP87_26850 [Streptomyces sp. S1D4-11]